MIFRDIIHPQSFTYSHSSSINILLEFKENMGTSQKWLETNPCLWRVCWHLTKDLICLYLLECNIYCIVEVCVRKCSDCLTPNLFSWFNYFLACGCVTLRTLLGYQSFPVALLFESHFWHIITSYLEITILRMSVKYVNVQLIMKSNVIIDLVLPSDLYIYSRIRIIPKRIKV